MENLNGMDNQLIDIEKDGQSAAHHMRNANSDLRNQRDIVTNIADKNKNIAMSLQKGKVVIRQISRTEWYHRVTLHVLIVVLFLLDVILAVYFIGNKF